MWHWQKKQKLKFFISHRSTFKYKLLLSLENVMDCVQSFEGRPPERLNLTCVSLGNTSILLYPNWLMRVLTPMTCLQCQHTSNTRIFFLSLVLVALITRELGLKGLSVSEQDAIDCVLDSLFVFLRLLLGGKKLLSEETAKETGS